VFVARPRIGQPCLLVNNYSHFVTLCLTSMLFNHEVCYLLVALLCVLQTPTEGYRVSVELDDAHGQLRQDSQPTTKVYLNHSVANRACRWGVSHCCCSAPTDNPNDVVCKHFLTGIFNGKERCSCGDSSKEDFGFTTSFHKPQSWRKVQWSVGLGLREATKQPFFDEFDRQCAAGTTLAFSTSQPAGSCDATRLFKFLPPWISSMCANTKLSKLREVEEKLANSKLLSSFDPKIDGSSLMGCVAVSGSCGGGFRFKDTIMNSMLDNLHTDLLYLGPVMRKQIMDYGTDMLQVESGLDYETSQLLLNWAFYHHDAENPYCDDEKMAADRDMLVRGLTVSSDEAEPLDRPWHYTEEQIYAPFRTQLRGTIQGMFQADCVKKVEAEVDLESAKAGVGIEIQLKGEKLEALQAEIQRASDSKNFMVAHLAQEKLKKLTVGRRLEPFAHFPVIGTLLEYIKSPTLQHPIEANEAELIRSFVGTLADLLEDKDFYNQLTRNGPTDPLSERVLDEWPMPPEIEGLWGKVRHAKHGERIWPESVIEELKKPSNGTRQCDCQDIEPDLGLHLLNMLPKIGIDFGNVRKDPLDGKLHSDKKTETLQHVNLEELARTMVTVEAGIEDPMFAVKYIMTTMTRAAEASGSTTGVPNVGAAGKVKGVLVGMPIIQNLWAMLESDNVNKVVFAQKMKWFFVANIIWAVWHGIERNLPPEDIVLGLLTAIMSTLSSFDYDGQWITFSNSKPFTDYMLGVYSVWNYRFVKQWASDENPKDQWQHVSVALSLPIAEALVNHDDIRYYINYRRDDLFHSMLMMMDRQLKETNRATSRCCCDWDTTPGFLTKMSITQVTFLNKAMDHDSMARKQKCVQVPQTATKWRGTCPAVHNSEWPSLDEEQSAFMSHWTSDNFLQLHQDPAACEDESKVVFVPEAAFKASWFQ